MSVSLTFNSSTASTRSPIRKMSLELPSSVCSSHSARGRISSNCKSIPPWIDATPPPPFTASARPPLCPCLKKTDVIWASTRSICLRVSVIFGLDCVRAKRKRVALRGEVLWDLIGAWSKW